MNWFILLHNWLCAVLFSGNAPEWLLKLHEKFGWLTG